METLPPPSPRSKRLAVQRVYKLLIEVKEKIGGRTKSYDLLAVGGETPSVRRIAGLLFGNTDGELQLIRVPQLDEATLRQLEETLNELLLKLRAATEQNGKAGGDDKHTERIFEDLMKVKKLAKSIGKAKYEELLAEDTRKTLRIASYPAGELKLNILPKYGAGKLTQLEETLNEVLPKLRAAAEQKGKAGGDDDHTGAIAGGGDQTGAIAKGDDDHTGAIEGGLSYDCAKTQQIGRTWLHRSWQKLRRLGPQIYHEPFQP